MMMKKNAKRFTVVLVICAMLMNVIAMAPVSAEEEILPEAIVEEVISVETVETEEPAAEEPVAEEPVVEEPAVEEPVVEEPVVEEPVVEEPVVEEPVVVEPVVEEPVVEEPVAEEPVVEEPVVEEPVVEEPVVEEPAVEEPAAEEPIVFSCELTAKLENEGDIFEGQQIVLNATVLNANKEFSFRWQRTPVERNEDEEEIWTDISNVLAYTFDATEEADDYFYRATVTAEDGAVLCSERISFDVLPAEENIVNEPETEETGDADFAEDESADTEDDPDGEEFIEIEENETPLGLTEIVILYTVDAADVRLDADELSDIFTVLEKGAAVTTVGQVGSWTRVVIGDQVGFIFSDLLAASMPEEETVEEETVKKAEEEPAVETAQLPEKKVNIFSTRRTVMDDGEYVLLSSQIEGFDGLDIIYQWECDQGNGFQPVQNANNDTYVFKASTESLSWNWRLTVYYR